MREIDLPKKIDLTIIPQWVTKKTPGRGEEIKEWYLSYFFWTTWKGKEDNLEDFRVQARASANAYIEALDEVADLAPEMENAMYSLLVDIDTKKLWRYQEYNGVMDFLEDKLAKVLARSPKSGMRWEIQNVISIVKWLEANKVPRALVLSIPQNLSKARVVADPIEEIINDNSLEQEEKLSQIRELMLKVANPDISKDDLREEYEKHRPRDPELIFIPGSFYILPRGEEMIVVHCKNKKQTAVIQNLLKGTVRIEIGDSTDLVKDISTKVSPSTFQMVGHRLDLDRAMLEPNIPDGMFMPLPEQMEYTILVQTSKLLSTINQVKSSTINIPILVLENNIQDDQNWDQLIAQKLKCSPKEEQEYQVINILVQALENYYPIPKDLDVFIPERRYRWQVDKVEENLSICLQIW